MMEVVCSRCGLRNGFSFSALECGECGGPLDLAEGTYEEPVEVVSLGEGNTPVVRLANVGRELGMERLYAKLEFLNPTGSFKDRGSAVMVSMLRNEGIGSAAEDSSGTRGRRWRRIARRRG